MTGSHNTGALVGWGGKWGFSNASLGFGRRTNRGINPWQVRKLLIGLVVAWSAGCGEFGTDRDPPAAAVAIRHQIESKRGLVEMVAIDRKMTAVRIAHEHGQSSVDLPLPARLAPPLASARSVGFADIWASPPAVAGFVALGDNDSVVPPDTHLVPTGSCWSRW